MNSLTHSSKTQSRQTCVAKLVHHLDRRVAAPAKRQRRPPPHPPSLLRPLLQNEWFRPCFRFGEAGKETPGLLRPSAPHLPSQNHHLALRHRRVLDTFSPCGGAPLPRQRHRCWQHGRWKTVAMQWRHECCVDCQLRSATKWQAIRQDLQPTLVTRIRRSDVKVT